MFAPGHSLPLVALLTLCMAALLCIGPAAHADNYRWERGTVCVDKDNTHDWGVIRAVAEWNEVDAGQPLLVLRDECPWAGSIHFFDSYRPYWDYGGAAWIWGEISHVEIEMNDQIQDRVGLPDDAWRRWKYYATAHEFGHALGLHHSNVEGSVMCYCTNYWTNMGAVTWSDRQSLRALY